MKDILSNLIIRRVYSVTTMYTETNTKNTRSHRPGWGMILKYEGETVYDQGKKQYLSDINNIVILPKSSSYEWCCKKAGHYSVIEFACDAECDTLFSIPVKNGEKILKIFKMLEHKRLSGDPLCEMECIRDVYSIILTLFSHSEKAYVPHSQVEKLAPAMDYISSHYAAKIKNDDLAKLTGLSTVYFRKLFTEVYGISPIRYINEIRMKKAREMLRSDYGSITDIAVSLGYQSIYDFSRDFKKHTGVSPSKYNRE